MSLNFQLSCTVKIGTAPACGATSARSATATSDDNGETLTFNTQYTVTPNGQPNQSGSIFTADTSGAAGSAMTLASAVLLGGLANIL